MSKKRSRGRTMRKQIKGVGLRCVRVLANGKWRFVKNSACGIKSKSK
jgi:hypothetical protein